MSMQHNSQHSKSTTAIIVQARARMRSDLPKVVFPIGGRPMVCCVVDACLAAGCTRVVVIVGHKQELVRDALKDYAAKGQVEFAVQVTSSSGRGMRCSVRRGRSRKKRGNKGTRYLCCAATGPLFARRRCGLSDRHDSVHASRDAGDERHRRPQRVRTHLS